MRVQVNLSDEIVEKLDYYSTLIGISRSALMAVFIGQGLMGYEKSFSVLENVGVQAAEILKSEKEKK